MKHRKRISRPVFCALAVLLSSFLPASAHRVGIPLTVLEWHSPSETWHLIHRLSSHDFAELIPEIGNGGLETREAQQGMAEFILSRFQIRGAQSAINFSYLGAEEDADSFWIYFQMQSPDQDIIIENGLVFEEPEADRRRHALVNINVGDATKTLLFTANQAPQRARLERLSADDTP